MKEFVKKYEIWIFLVLAPLINTLMTLANSKGIIKGFVYTHGRFYVLLSLLICIVGYTRGKEGIKDMLKPMLNWKVKPMWFIFSLFFALTIAALTLVLKDFYLGSEYSMPLKLNFGATTLRSTFFLLTWAFLGEVVWVSYAVRQLSKVTKPFYASQVIGFFWTLWWLPSVFINTGVIIDLPVWPLLLNMLGAAGMCTIVYEKTKSGICVWILQFMMNMSVILLPVSPKIGGIPTYETYAVLYFLTMLCFMYFNKKTIREKKSTNSVLQ